VVFVGRSLWRGALFGSPRTDQEAALSLRWSIALAGALAAACAAVTAPQAGTACGPAGYAYAGVQATRGHGIAAVVTSLGTPAVESGHVAGWVGVGAPGEGPGGSDEWIQVGLNSVPGTGNRLYYEVMRPGAKARYAEVAASIGNGRRVRIAVLATATDANAWRVWVNGRPVTPPIELAGSRGALTPMAMGESWDGGRPACNRYSYRFERVSVAAAPGGSWQRAPRPAAVLQDPGYRLIKRAPAAFEASAIRSLSLSPQ
jgi:hypothetical protein